MPRVIKHKQADRGLDLYETPEIAVWWLIRAEQLPRRLWEPQCGRMAIVRVLRACGHEVYASDVVNRGNTDQNGVMDFLSCNTAPSGVQGAVMNPPFGNAAALHIQHGLTLVPYIAALLPLNFLEAGNPKTKSGRARLAVVDGGKLSRVHVFRSRLPMMHRDGWTGPIATSTVAYAWFIWERSHDGPPTVHRIA